MSIIIDGVEALPMPDRRVSADYIVTGYANARLRPLRQELDRDQSHDRRIRLQRELLANYEFLVIALTENNQRWMKHCLDAESAIAEPATQETEPKHVADTSDRVQQFIEDFETRKGYKISKDGEGVVRQLAKELIEEMSAVNELLVQDIRQAAQHIMNMTSGNVTTQLALAECQCGYCTYLRNSRGNHDKQ